MRFAQNEESRTATDSRDSWPPKPIMMRGTLGSAAVGVARVGVAIVGVDEPAIDRLAATPAPSASTETDIGIGPRSTWIAFQAASGSLSERRIHQSMRSRRGIQWLRLGSLPLVDAGRRECPNRASSGESVDAACRAEASAR